MRMKKKPNYLLNIGIILIIAILVLVTVLSSDTAQIYEALKSFNPRYLWLCLLMVLIWQLSVAFTLKILTKDLKKDYSLKEGLLNSLIASFFHGITPSSSGGQFVQMYVFKRQGVNSGSAASILWSEFIIYQSTMCLFSLLMIFLRFKHFYTNYSNLFFFVLIGFALHSFVIVFLFALGYSRRFHNFLATKGIAWGVRLHLIKDEIKARQSLENNVERFGFECRRLRKRKGAIFFGVLSCLFRLVAYYSIPYIIFRSFGLAGNFKLYFDALGMASFVAVTAGLIPIPGASGGIEAIFIMMFSNLFPNNYVLTTMLIWRFFTYYLLLLVGGICFIALKLSDKGEV